MTSFQTGVTPPRRAAARYVSQVRRVLQQALMDEKSSRGLTQSEVARQIGVHRSVISRELKGYMDITHGRVGELAWAMGYKPRLVLEKVDESAEANSVDEHQPPTRAMRQLPGTTAIYQAQPTPMPAAPPAPLIRVEVYEAA